MRCIQALTIELDANVSVIAERASLVASLDPWRPINLPSEFAGYGTVVK
jgi:hypothetical protein